MHLSFFRTRDAAHDERCDTTTLTTILLYQTYATLFSLTGMIVANTFTPLPIEMMWVATAMALCLVLMFIVVVVVMTCGRPAAEMPTDAIV